MPPIPNLSVPSRRSPRPGVVLLDAMGTLLRLEPPGPRLAAGLEAAGHPNPPEVVDRALRAEIAHYRARMHRGSDPLALRELRSECAGVLATGLDDAPGPRVMLELLIDALRFALFPDVLPLLDRLVAAGVPAVVVSNWDCGLSGHLSALGLDGRLAGVVASAEVGAAKPDARIFAAALALAGVPPHRAVHCGDDPDCDLRGATGAGVGGVLLDRRGAHPGATPRVGSLRELGDLLLGA